MNEAPKTNDLTFRSLIPIFARNLIRFWQRQEVVSRQSCKHRQFPQLAFRSPGKPQLDWFQPRSLVADSGYKHH
jgi:hypothetical protein